MRITLSGEQHEAVERMAAEPTRAALNAALTGVGKTVMAVELAKRLSAQTILVIAPIKRPVVNAWKATFEKQGVTLPFYVIDSSHPEHFEMLRTNVPGVYYVGREYFALSATSLKPKEKKDGTWTKGRERKWSWSKVQPDLAIYDEVQSVSNRWSEGYIVLKTLKAGYKVAMSATPQGNRFKGIWSVCRWLWPEAINPKTGERYVDRSQWNWAAEWAKQEFDVYAGLKITDERVPGAFVNSLPCYVRIEDNRAPVETRVVKIDLTPRQRALYDKMERDMLVWLDEHPLVADIPIVQRMRMRQITLGEPTLIDNGRLDDDGQTIYDVDFDDNCESAKIDALHTIISKYHPDEPILILMDSQKFARVVATRLGSQASEWSGAVSQKERQHIFEEFGKSVKYIVATVPAVAEGLDGLQRVCHTEVWLSQSLNEMLNHQARGRVDRQGQTEDVIRYYVHARKTDDDRHFQDLLGQHISQRETLKKEA